PAKARAPGAKEVWRSPGGDVVALRDESAPAADAEPLLRPVVREGSRLEPAPSIGEMAARFDADLDRIPERARRLRDPEPVVAGRSDALAALTERTRGEALHRAGLYA